MPKFGKSHAHEKTNHFLNNLNAAPERPGIGAKSNGHRRGARNRLAQGCAHGLTLAGHLLSSYSAPAAGTQSWSPGACCRRSEPTSRVGATGARSQTEGSTLKARAVRSRGCSFRFSGSGPHVAVTWQALGGAPRVSLSGFLREGRLSDSGVMLFALPGVWISFSVVFSWLHSSFYPFSSQILPFHLSTFLNRVWVSGDGLPFCGAPCRGMWLRVRLLCSCSHQPWDPRELVLLVHLSCLSGSSVTPSGFCGVRKKHTGNDFHELVLWVPTTPPSFFEVTNPTKIRRKKQYRRKHLCFVQISEVI